jgi:putative ABC transport system permease protein
VHEWLKRFAYRIDINPGPFIIATLSSLLIALLAMSFQSIKAAAANPVDSLRYE